VTQRFRALIAEDEPQMASIVAFALETEGFDVVVVTNGFDAVEAISHATFDVVVLDVMMPRMGGLEVCRYVRSHAATRNVGVLVVTAKSETEDVIAGLEAGADDYIAKPFHPRELALRAASLARRIHIHDADQARDASPEFDEKLSRIKLDFHLYAAFLDGEPLRLTANEFRLLSCLVQHQGDAVTWELLLREAWGVESWEGGREMVKAAVYRLRQKLNDDPHEPRFIVAVRGVGYRMLPF
jgi:DNA-binding response OmpR family regulator